MLASHRQEHPRDFGILANVFVKRLPDELPQRYIVLGLAADFAGVTAETAPRVDEPAESLAVVGRLHPFSPVLLGLKLVGNSFRRGLNRRCLLGGIYDWQGRQGSR